MKLESAILAGGLSLQSQSLTPCLMQVSSPISLIASNIYRSRASNGGRYYIGHGVNLGLLFMGIIVAPLYAYLLRKKNRERDAWQAHQLTLPEEQRTKFTIQELHEAGDNAKGEIVHGWAFSTC